MPHPSQEGVVAPVRRQSGLAVAEAGAGSGASAACVRGAGGSASSRRSTCRRLHRLGRIPDQVARPPCGRRSERVTEGRGSTELETCTTERAPLFFALRLLQRLQRTGTVPVIRHRAPGRSRVGVTTWAAWRSSLPKPLAAVSPSSGSRSVGAAPERVGDQAHGGGRTDFTVEQAWNKQWIILGSDGEWRTRKSVL